MLAGPVVGVASDVTGVASPVVGVPATVAGAAPDEDIVTREFQNVPVGSVSKGLGIPSGVT